MSINLISVLIMVPFPLVLSHSFTTLDLKQEQQVEIFQRLFSNEPLGRNVGVFNMRSRSSQDLISDNFSNLSGLLNLIVSTSDSIEEFPEHVQIKDLDYLIFFIDSRLKVNLFIINNLLIHFL